MIFWYMFPGLDLCYEHTDLAQHLEHTDLAQHLEHTDLAQHLTAAG